MKITNNEIVVELPEKEINCYLHNLAIAIVGNLNPPRVVDVEALEVELCRAKQSWTSYDIDKMRLEEFQAQHLAANLDKWMVEKK